MRLLTFSTLYPNAARPSHGIFVENRLRHVMSTGAASSVVVAPVPWFPSSDARFGSYAEYRKVPRSETRHGIDVRHPRYLVIPKVGMTIAPFLLAMGARREIKGLIDRGYDFDLIDAHYFYPDGVAAVILGLMFGKPVIITARGTDINLIPTFTLPRRLILWAARRAGAMITVCKALKDALVDLGADRTRITVLRNGVDLDMFRPPEDRDALRSRLGMTGFTILSVGGLVERKGHHIAIDAMPALPGATLLIAGAGEERARLEEQVRRLGVADRVRFLGNVDHASLRDYYGASDTLVLASSREGWANVLLESMACGTPVVATSIWGTPEVVAAPEAGVLMSDRSSAAMVKAVGRMRVAMPDRAATRRYAESFSWDDTTRGQLALFAEVVGRATAVAR